MCDCQPFKVRVDEDELRAKLECDEAGHCATHAVFACLIVGWEGERHTRIFNKQLGIYAETADFSCAPQPVEIIPIPPTAIGLLLSSGRSSIATDAKYASMSTCIQTRESSRVCSRRSSSASARHSDARRCPGSLRRRSSIALLQPRVRPSDPSIHPCKKIKGLFVPSSFLQ